MYFICLHLHFFDDGNQGGQKSTSNYAGSQQEAIADIELLSSSRTVLVFEKKNCDPFFQNKGFYARGKSQKSAFSVERHYNVGSKMMQNLHFRG